MFLDKIPYQRTMLFTVAFLVALVITFVVSEAVDILNKEQVSTVPAVPAAVTHIDTKRLENESRTSVRPVLKVPKAKTKPIVTHKAKPVKAKKTVVKKKTVKKKVRHRKPKKVSMSAIARCIGKYESGNNPTAENPYSSASGYFQFTTGTWNNYGGYHTAGDAPLSVQLRKFYIVWNGGAGAHNWVTAHKCI